VEFGMSQSVLSDITPFESYDDKEVMICGKGYCRLFHQNHSALPDVQEQE
jgi:hypothetical protein